MTPRAKAVEHPNVEGAHTVIDPRLPGFLPIIVNKAAAEALAAARNLRR